MTKVNESILVVTATAIGKEGDYDGNGRSSKVMEGHGRSWKVMEGTHGRSWKVMEGHGRLWKDPDLPWAGLSWADWANWG
jgi:hypothetical protein